MLLQRDGAAMCARFLLRHHHRDELERRPGSRPELGFGVRERLGSGRTRSAKSASMAASSVSVLASRPIDFPKSEPAAGSRRPQIPGEAKSLPRTGASYFPDASAHDQGRAERRSPVRRERRFRRGHFRLPRLSAWKSVNIEVALGDVDSDIGLCVHVVLSAPRYTPVLRESTRSAQPGGHRSVWQLSDSERDGQAGGPAVSGLGAEALDQDGIGLTGSESRNDHRIIYKMAGSARNRAATATVENGQRRPKPGRSKSAAAIVGLHDTISRRREDPGDQSFRIHYNPLSPPPRTRYEDPHHARPRQGPSRPPARRRRLQGHPPPLSRYPSGDHEVVAEDVLNNGTEAVEHAPRRSGAPRG